MYMQKGAPILRSALSSELRLELTYRAPPQERTEELKTEVEQPKLKCGLFRSTPTRPRAADWPPIHHAPLIGAQAGLLQPTSVRSVRFPSPWARNVACRS